MSLAVFRIPLGVLCTVVAFALPAFSQPISTQEHRSEQVLRQYPIAGAREVPVTSNIGVSAVAPFVLSDAVRPVVAVTGSRSGSHVMQYHLSDDHRTFIIEHPKPFALDEEVRVSMTCGTDAGILQYSFVFHTMVRDVRPFTLTEQVPIALLLDSSMMDTLPTIKIVQDKAEPGIVYLANFTFGNKNPNTFLLNLDEHGDVTRHQKLAAGPALDLKRQPNGLTTFFHNGKWKFLAMDSAWNIVDSFMTTNGYYPDPHEILLFPEGGYAMMGVSYSTLDSSDYRAGMVPNASIGGNVIQIFDAHGNETFEWRGIDHYRVLDAIHEKLKDSSIDFEHANSLDFDENGNVIISNRHLAEVSKIDRATGAFLWRLGGAHNQFTLLGDSIWFSYQHDARLPPNGHLTLFDNSNFDSVEEKVGYIHQSRALEYVIDTQSMTATLVWQYHHTPETFTVAMGNVQRLPNGNTLIGWGANNDVSITEIAPDNSTVFELAMGNSNYSYRAFKYLLPAPPQSVKTAPPFGLAAFDITIINRVPCAHFTTIDDGNVAIEVEDILGRTMGARISTFESAGEHSRSIPLSACSNGLYYCVLRFADGQAIARPFAIVQ